jgi:hypothetical protein
MAEVTPSAIRSSVDQTKIAGYLIGGAILYFGIVRPILKRTGVIQSQEELKNEKQIQDNRGADKSNPWNPNYYKGRSTDPSWLPWNTAVALSKQIYDAKNIWYRFFTDDENTAIAAFNGLSTKKQLSLLSNAFQKIYKKDLYNYLESFMSAEQLTSVNGKVKNLK